MKKIISIILIGVVGIFGVMMLLQASENRKVNRTITAWTNLDAEQSTYIKEITSSEQKLKSKLNSVIQKGTTKAAEQAKEELYSIQKEKRSSIDQLNISIAEYENVLKKSESIQFDETSKQKNWTNFKTTIKLRIANVKKIHKEVRNAYDKEMQVIKLVTGKKANVLSINAALTDVFKQQEVVTQLQNEYNTLTVKLNKAKKAFHS
ncbi:MAG: hypothetical protein ACRCWQ_06305 [Bacilli bacterium]